MRLFPKALLSIVTSAALVASIGAPAFAETMTSEQPWTVTFTQSDDMECNFDSEDVAQLVSDIQPGDTARMAVTLSNENSRSTDWYMTTKILRSLEEAAENAKGGAYTYTLTYTDPANETTTFFSSDTVGGESSAGENVGLHEVSDISSEYFYLGTLTKGQEGLVQLDIMLDGETQGNSYQDTLADLSMDFAVEFTPDSGEPIKNIVNVGRTAGFAQTGDQFMVIMCVMGGIAALGLIVLIIAIIGRRKGNKARREVR